MGCWGVKLKTRAEKGGGVMTSGRQKDQAGKINRLVEKKSTAGILITLKEELLGG